MSLVDTNWLEENINNVKIVDCSWHMPQTQRSGLEEYNKEHIPNAIFFDLDKNSKLDTDLPHMLTDSRSWEKIISNMGISNNDRIVIYDNSDVISSCRCWYNLIYYGHDPKLVHVLNGGLKKWKKENKITNNKKVITKTSQYLCKENKELVKNKDATFYARVDGDSMIGAGLEDGDLLVIDRSLNPENGRIADELGDSFTTGRS